NGKRDSSYAIKEGTITLDNIFYEQRITQLNKLIIPASVQKIEGYFEGCYNLLFEVESENPYFSSKDGALYNKEQTKIFYWPAANGDIYLNGISVIGNFCFYNNERITSLTLLSPVGGTVIGSCAFLDCWNLSSVDLGGTKEIGFGSFDTCNLESVTIPASTERIGSYAFYDNQNLSSVTFANTTGWYATTSDSYTGGEAVTVTNSSQNATKLKNDSGDWYNKYLYKTDSSSGGSGGGGDPEEDADFNGTTWVNSSSGLDLVFNTATGSPSASYDSIIYDYTVSGCVATLTYTSSETVAFTFTIGSVDATTGILATGAGVSVEGTFTKQQ
ncbi:MAG: leucine-rich repeat domain-containing protein, partial [Treponema sp.]|nr:leucine-rich repeat domain-containing protein [Treponema sp.]